MTIDFTCQKCDAAFDLEASDVVEGTEKLQCPHCDAKPPTAVAEDFALALTELMTQVQALSRKFTVSFSVDSEEASTSDEDEDEDKKGDGEEEEEGEEGDEDEAEDDGGDEGRY